LWGTATLKVVEQLSWLITITQEQRNMTTFILG